MASRNQPQTFGHAMKDAKQQASNVAEAANTAARETANSFETAARGVIETQPYTAVGIALAIGWLMGRMHRPV